MLRWRSQELLVAGSILFFGAGISLVCCIRARIILLKRIVVDLFRVFYLLSKVSFNSHWLLESRFSHNKVCSKVSSYRRYVCDARIIRIKHGSFMYNYMISIAIV